MKIVLILQLGLISFCLSNPKPSASKNYQKVDMKGKLEHMHQKSEKIKSLAAPGAEAEWPSIGGWFGSGNDNNQQQQVPTQPQPEQQQVETQPQIEQQPQNQYMADPTPTYGYPNQNDWQERQQRREYHARSKERLMKNEFNIGEEIGELWSILAKLTNTQVGQAKAVVRRIVQEFEHRPDEDSQIYARSISQSFCKMQVIEEDPIQMKNFVNEIDGLPQQPGQEQPINNNPY